jgi:UPF0042 nucleotide-binding protein
VTFQSFGFKHGPPRDADLAFDVRFLTNPHYEYDLRPLTGQDHRVVEHIARDGRLEAFYDRFFPFLDFLLPQYIAEGKAHLVVAIVERVAEHVRERPDCVVAVSHRDIER